MTDFKSRSAVAGYQNFQPDHLWGKQVASLLGGSVVLDGGSGPGLRAAEYGPYLRRGTRLLLADNSQVMLDAAEVNLRKAGLKATLLLANLTEIDWPGETVRGILWRTVVHHMTPVELPLAVREAARLLATDGRLLIQTRFPSGPKGLPTLLLHQLLADPQELAWDTARWPAVEMLAEQMNAAGLSAEIRTITQNEGSETPAALAARIRRGQRDSFLQHLGEEKRVRLAQAVLGLGTSKISGETPWALLIGTKKP